MSDTSEPGPPQQRRLSDLISEGFFRAMSQGDTETARHLRMALASLLARETVLYPHDRRSPLGAARKRHDLILSQRHVGPGGLTLPADTAE